MSIDSSLKSSTSLTRHRNVLKRAERLAILEDEGRWVEGKDTLLGLPKVGHRKSAAGKKVKKVKTEGEGADSDAAATEGAAS